MKGTVCRLESMGDILKLIFRDGGTSHAGYYRVSSAIIVALTSYYMHCYSLQIDLFHDPSSWFHSWIIV